MKKLVLLMSFIAILMSCSTDDDSQSIPDPIQGCTDPQAVNYNPDADENDNSCLYSIIGNWDCITYEYGELDILSAYIYIETTFYDDNSYYTEGELITGEFIQDIGLFNISGENNSTLTFISEDETTTVFSIIDISSNNLSIYSSDVGGEEATIEYIR
tara:strand:+ start:216 stop:689 length:474 start_codon:yes stop_codon:yes gene_type:complete